LSREAKIEEELYRLAMNSLEKRNFVIDGVKFDPIEPQFHVDSGIADLMVPTHPSKPLLILECKRKTVSDKGVVYLRNFDPMSNRVITQALSYAVQSGAPLFATTNGKVIAVFMTPERGEAFRIDRHRLLIKEIQLKAGVVDEILVLVARWKAGLAITKTPVDWAFILRLRSFTDYLAWQILPALESKLKRDRKFKKAFEDFAHEVGGTTVEHFSREAAYILMNKIVFYKVLERYYAKLPRMKPIKSRDVPEYRDELFQHFTDVIVITRDFEPVFSTGLYEQAPLPDEEDVLDEINSFIEEMDTYRLEELGSDVVGFIHERLIPDEERHRLGQFYTPPQIAELITRWAIREPTDRVLDPACGSGTFLVKAYGALKELKPLDPDVHKAILSQVYCVDINPFATHLTAMNLAMRDVTHPTSDMNVIVGDFFMLRPNQRILAPYAVRTAQGEMRREVQIPLMSAVIANPPYTRWTEMSEQTRKLVSKSIGGVLRKYRLTPGSVRSEPVVYMHFVMHGFNFLSEGGRLAMIISNSWLQTDYGIKFGRYLLDNYKIRGIIDFASRIFNLPTIATLVILLERNSVLQEREENSVSYIYVDSQVEVPVILDAITNPHKYKNRFFATQTLQRDLPTDEKWMPTLFGAERVLDKVRASGKTTAAEDQFDICTGNTKWAHWAVTHGARTNLGANEFFYLAKDTVDKWGLSTYAKPLIASPINASNFTFTKEDWLRLRGAGKVSHLFVCHQPRGKLPKNVTEYIAWGETGCLTKVGKHANESDTSRIREQERLTFRGWYDLGGTTEAVIIAPYYSRYRERFIRVLHRVAVGPDFLAYVPRVDFSIYQIKALLAYLNSTIAQLHVETHGRIPGGVGPIALEIKQAREMPILDVTKLSSKQLQILSEAFDKLECRARTVGGANSKATLEKLLPEIKAIDDHLAQIFELSEEHSALVLSTVNLLVERRLTKSGEARPESVLGEEAPRIRPPKKSGRDTEARDSWPLEKWT